MRIKTDAAMQKEQERQSARRKERMARGICAHCGKHPALRNMQRCEPCRARQKQRYDNQRAMMIGGIMPLTTVDLSVKKWWHYIDGWR